MDRVISLLAALVGLIALGGAILVHTNGDAQRTEMAAQIAQLKVSVDLLGRQSGATPAATQLPAIPSAEPPISEYVAAESSSSASIPSFAPSSASSEPPPLPSVAPLTPPSSASSAAASQEPAAPQLSASSAAPDTQSAEVKALQDRIASLEQTMRDQAAQLDAAKAQIGTAPPASSAPASAEVADISPSAPAPAGSPQALDASGPTKDCIPIGTRFMATSGDNFPICKTKVVVKVAAVADGFASINGAGDIAAGTTGNLSKGCSVVVFSADSGYAEMRVSCQ